MNKPTHLGMPDGKIYDRKALSPKQLKEIDKQMAKDEKIKQIALSEANKMLNPSRLKIWARRIAIMAMLTPVAPVASCVINHYYPQQPVTAPEKTPEPTSTQDSNTDVKQAKKAPEKLPEWYANPENVAERDKLILENFNKFLEGVKSELKKVVKEMPDNSRTEPIKFELEINNVTFKGLMIVDKVDNKVTLHVLLVGPPCKAGQFHTEAHLPIPIEIEI